MILTLGNPYLLSAHTINLGMATESKQLWPQSSRENLLSRAACFSLSHTCGLGWEFSFRLVYSCTFFDDFFKMPHFENAPFSNEILGLQLPLGSVFSKRLFLTSIYNCLSLVLISSPLGSLLPQLWLVRDRDFPYSSFVFGWILGHKDRGQAAV